MFANLFPPFKKNRNNIKLIESLLKNVSPKAILTRIMPCLAALPYSQAILTMIVLPYSHVTISQRGWKDFVRSSTPAYFTGYFGCLYTYMYILDAYIYIYTYIYIFDALVERVV